MHSRNNPFQNKILRRVSFLLAFFIYSSFSFAQRGITNQSFFNNNLGLHNPSLLGNTQKLNTNVFFKMGDLGTEFKNYLLGFNFEYSHKRSHNFGVGGTIQRESDWMSSQAYVGYGYKLDIKNTAWSIGFGVNAGFKSISHLSYLLPLAPLDTSIYAHNNQNQIQAYLSTGVNVWWRDRVFFSVSSKNFLKYSDYKTEDNKYNQEKSLNNAPGISIGIGTRDPAFGDSITNKTSFEANLFYHVYFKGTLKGNIEFNFGLNIKNIINPRVGFRWLDNYYIVLGLQGRVYRGLYLSYAYDIAIDPVSSNLTGKGSHEFGLGYFIPHTPRKFDNIKKREKRKKKK